MIDSWGWKMVINFSYVFAGIFVVLLLARAMGAFEKALASKEKNKIKQATVFMGICSLGVGFAVAALFSTFLNFPNILIKILIVFSMGAIIFSSSKKYIERTFNQSLNK